MKGAAAQPGPSDVDASSEGLIAMMDACGVKRACAVQRAFIYGYDNRYILDAARRYPERISPVLVVDAADAATPGLLRKLAGVQRLGGIRLSAPRAEPPDLGWLTSAAAMETWQAADELGLSVAVILFRTQREPAIREIGRIAKRFPRLPIVIDHAAVPHGTIYDGPFAGVPETRHPAEGAPAFGVDDLLLGLVERERIFFKITSINFRRLAAADVPAVSFVSHLARTFGAARLMWGSDIGQTPGAYVDKTDAARRSVAGLSPKEQALVLHGTAALVYGTDGA